MSKRTPNEWNIYFQQASNPEELVLRLNELSDILKYPQDERRKNDSDNTLAFFCKQLILKGIIELLLDLIGENRPKTNREALYVSVRDIFCAVCSIVRELLKPYCSKGIGIYDRQSPQPPLLESEFTRIFGRLALPHLLDLLGTILLSTEVPIMPFFPTVGFLGKRGEPATCYSLLLEQLITSTSSQELVAVFSETLLKSPLLIKNLGLLRSLDTCYGFDLILRTLCSLPKPQPLPELKPLEDYIYKYPLQFFGRLKLDCVKLGPQQLAPPFCKDRTRLSELDEETLLWNDARKLFAKLKKSRSIDTNCLLELLCMEATGLKAASNDELTSDPFFLILDCNHKPLYKSKTIKKDIHPRWIGMEMLPPPLKIPLWKPIIIQFWDQNKVTANVFLGEVILYPSVLSVFHHLCRQHVVILTLDLSSIQSEKSTKKKEHRDDNRGTVHLSMTIDY